MISTDYHSPRMKKIKEDWRDSLKSDICYVKRFAIIPVKCHDGKTVWMSRYYKMYRVWAASLSYDDIVGDHSHPDFVENITQEEFVVRKLIGAR